MKKLKMNKGGVGIVVLGMHRSGTSAMTGLLEILGFELGDNSKHLGEDNSKGFKEHQEINHINESIMNVMGSSWSDLLPLPLGWEKKRGVGS